MNNFSQHQQMILQYLLLVPAGSLFYLSGVYFPGTELVNVCVDKHLINKQFVRSFLTTLQWIWHRSSRKMCVSCKTEAKFMSSIWNHYIKIFV